MSTLISNVRFRAKFSTIFRLWNAYSAFFQRLCSRPSFWCAVLETKSFESKGMKNSRFSLRIIESWQSIIFQAGFYIQSDVLRVWFWSSKAFEGGTFRLCMVSLSSKFVIMWFQMFDLHFYHLQLFEPHQNQNLKMLNSRDHYRRELSGS